MRFWVVLEEETEDHLPGFGGVFDDRNKAIAACYGPTYFVEPCTLNEAIGPDDVEWEEKFYPLAPEKNVRRK